MVSEIWGNISEGSDWLSWWHQAITWANIDV